MFPKAGISNRISPAMAAILVGVAMLAVAFYLFESGPWGADRHPGYFIFFAWAAFCAAAVLSRRILVWAALALLPLGLLAWESWGWFARPSWDGYGFFPWGAIALFTGMCLVVAATGTMSILLGARDGRTK